MAGPALCEGGPGSGEEGAVAATRDQRTREKIDAKAGVLQCHDDENKGIFAGRVAGVDGPARGTGLANAMLYSRMQRRRSRRIGMFPKNVMGSSTASVAPSHLSVQKLVPACQLSACDHGQRAPEYQLSARARFPVTADRKLSYFSPLCAFSETRQTPDIAQPLQRLRRPPTRAGPAGQL